MAKTVIELALELAEIVDKQRELAAREAQIKQELQQHKSQPNGDRPRIEFDSPITTAIKATSSMWNIAAKIDKKTVNVLKRTKRIMTNREVAEAIAEIENNADPDYTRLLVRKFSAVVGGKAKNNRTFRRIEIEGVLHYGLADWFNSDGTVKPEYKHEE